MRREATWVAVSVLSWVDDNAATCVEVKPPISAAVSRLICVVVRAAIWAVVKAATCVVARLLN